MVKKLLNKISISVVLALALILPASSIVIAATPTKDDICKGVGLAGGTSGCEEPTDGPNVNSTVKLVVSILSFIVGVAAVIMIIIGGFKYITSSGDSNNISSAKNTILYAIIGLVIVALAQVIVRFVLQKATQA